MKIFYAAPLLFSLFLSACEGSSSDSIVSGSSGTGGSLAGMTILDGKLHILSNNYIKSFSLTSPLRPELVGNDFINDAETLFTYQDKYLFVGTSLGIEIYQQAEMDNAEVDNYLTPISNFEHIRAYDPVIAVDGTAYFTTRDGFENGSSSSTDYIGLLNIEDVNQPNLIAEYNELIEPVGLALRDNILYVCDKVEGLSLFTTEPDYQSFNNNGLPYTLVLQEINDFVACTDIIATDDQLIVTSSEGIAQLRINNKQVTQLSLLRNL